MADPDASAEPDRGAGDDTGAGRGSPPGAPRWVKVSGIVALVLALLITAVLLLGGGGHGPAQHISSGRAGGLTPVTNHAALSGTVGSHVGGDDALASGHPG